MAISFAPSGPVLGLRTRCEERWMSPRRRLRAKPAARVIVQYPRAPSMKVTPADQDEFLSPSPMELSVQEADVRLLDNDEDASARGSASKPDFAGGTSDTSGSRDRSRGGVRSAVGRRALSDIAVARGRIERAAESVRIRVQSVLIGLAVQTNAAIGPARSSWKPLGVFKWQEVKNSDEMEDDDVDRARAKQRVRQKKNVVDAVRKGSVGVMYVAFAAVQGVTSAATAVSSAYAAGRRGGRKIDTASASDDETRARRRAQRRSRRGKVEAEESHASEEDVELRPYVESVRTRAERSTRGRKERGGSGPFPSTSSEESSDVEEERFVEAPVTAHEPALEGPSGASRDFRVQARRRHNSVSRRASRRRAEAETEGQVHQVRPRRAQGARNYGIKPQVLRTSTNEHDVGAPKIASKGKTMDSMDSGLGKIMAGAAKAGDPAIGENQSAGTVSNARHTSREPTMQEKVVQGVGKVAGALASNKGIVGEPSDSRQAAFVQKMQEKIALGAAKVACSISQNDGATGAPGSPLIGNGSDPAAASVFRPALPQWRHEDVSKLVVGAGAGALAVSISAAVSGGALTAALTASAAVVTASAITPSPAKATTSVAYNLQGFRRSKVVKRIDNFLEESSKASVQGASRISVAPESLTDTACPTEVAVDSASEKGSLPSAFSGMENPVGSSPKPEKFAIHDSSGVGESVTATPTVDAPSTDAQVSGAFVRNVSSVDASTVDTRGGLDFGNVHVANVATDGIALNQVSVANGSRIGAQVSEVFTADVLVDDFRPRENVPRAGERPDANLTKSVSTDGAEETIDTDSFEVLPSKPAVFATPFVGVLLSVLDDLAFNIEQVVARVSRRAAAAGFPLFSQMKLQESSWELHRVLQHRASEEGERA